MPASILAGAEGKRLRSTILLLLASSLSAVPLSPAYLTVDESPPAEHPEDPRRQQQRLAGAVGRWEGWLGSWVAPRRMLKVALRTGFLGRQFPKTLVSFFNSLLQKSRS